MALIQYFLIFVLGGIGYGLLEIIWRGHTHWTMLICGGICFMLMYLISASGMSFLRKCILSAAAITAVEFFTGCLVNLRMHWHVWDYSAVRFNVLGQICPLFSLYWLALSVFGIALCSFLRPLLQRLLRA